MNQLQVFNNPEFGQMRTLEEGGKTLFCGADVAKALGYSNPRKAIGDHCKGVTKRDTPTASGNQEMSFIPEGDVYRLIVRSNLPAAEKFERWVFDEVLPSLRKTGRYEAYKPMTQMELIAAQAQAMLEIERRSSAALQIAEAAQEKVEELVATLQIGERSIRTRVAELCEKHGPKFRATILSKLYRELEAIERCDLASRVARKKARMKAAGCKRTEWGHIHKLDVIIESSRLSQRFSVLLDGFVAASN